VLDPGTRAPDFTLVDQFGQPVTLSAFGGTKRVLLVFFPLAFTPVCRGELDVVQQRLDGYQNASTQVLAISVGPPPTHRIWASESGFEFPILSDFWPHGSVAQSYGVFNPANGHPNRGTFVVDRAGVIRFAEMKQPGEMRDAAVWDAALAAVRGE
jgi:mycoredoxin-dependent peroxiredoxin